MLQSSVDTGPLGLIPDAHAIGALARMPDASVMTPQRRKGDPPDITPGNANKSPKLPNKSPKSSTPLQQSTLLLKSTSSAFTEAKTVGSKVETYTILILGLLTATFENPP